MSLVDQITGDFLSNLERLGFVELFRAILVEEENASRHNHDCWITMDKSDSGSVYIRKRWRGMGLRGSVQILHRFSDHPLPLKEGVRYPAFMSHILGQHSQRWPRVGKHVTCGYDPNEDDCFDVLFALTESGRLPPEQAERYQTLCNQRGVTYERHKAEWRSLTIFDSSEDVPSPAWIRARGDEPIAVDIEGAAFNQRHIFTLRSGKVVTVKLGTWCALPATLSELWNLELQQLQQQ